MSHDNAAGRTLRPKPNERYRANSLGLHGQGQQPLEDPLDGSVHRPVREKELLPVAQACFLKAPSHRNRQYGPKAMIVEASNHQTVIEPSPTSRRVVPVAFVTKLFDDLVGIHGKLQSAVVDADIGQSVIELGGDLL